jgi:hypothetical protein
MVGTDTHIPEGAGGDSENAYQILLEYSDSFGKELMAKKDRLDAVVGEDHWLTVGNYKEAILRNLLKDRIPKKFEVGTGFVVARENADFVKSKQIDILVWDSSSFSPLFRDGDLVIIPPEACVAAIEVKSTLDHSTLVAGLENLEKVFSLVRRINARSSGGYTPKPYLAFFSYKKDERVNFPSYVFDKIREFYRNGGDEDCPWKFEDRLGGNDRIGHGIANYRTNWRWIDYVGVLDSGYFSNGTWYVNNRDLQDVYALFVPEGRKGYAFTALHNGLMRRLLSPGRDQSGNPGVESLLVNAGFGDLQGFMRLGAAGEKIEQLGGIKDPDQIAKLSEIEHRG